MPFEKGKSGNPDTQIKPGQVLNPTGRPKLPDLKGVMAEILGEEVDGKTALKKIIAKLQDLAEKGNIKAAEVLLARGYGLPKEYKEITITKPTIIDWGDEPDTPDKEAEGSKTDN